METAAAHAGRRVGHGLRACMESPVPRKRRLRSGQEHRKLVLVELVLVAGFIAVVKEVPAVNFLYERQLF